MVGSINVVKIVVVVLMVALVVALLYVAYNAIANFGAIGQAAFYHLDEPPETSGFESGAWSQTDIIADLLPRLFSSSAYGFNYISPFNVLLAAFSGAFVVVGVVMLLRLVVRIVGAG